MSVEQAIVVHEEQRVSIRQALKALLYLQAKVEAEIGAVPPDLSQRVKQLTRALCSCIAQINDLRARKIVDEAAQRADIALAAVEVEQALLT